MDVRVATYNVLSHKLCSSDFFFKCKPEDCVPETRYERVIGKINEEIGRESVLCLQEVSADWAGKFLVHFQKKNYNFVHWLYGNHFNGFMGVAIAYPMAKYSLAEATLEQVSKSVEWKSSPEKRSKESAPRASLMSRVLGLLTFWRGSAAASTESKNTDEYRDFELAKRRSNAMVLLQLKDEETEKVFTVATYHMPCAFRQPPLMTIHAALIAQATHKHAKGTPFILAGDFNWKPHDPQYAFYERGVLDAADSAYPTLPPYEPWRPDLPHPLKSAYKEATGSEPPYTNCAQVGGMEELFRETLDYIWLSPGVEVKGVKALPGVEKAQSSFPTDEEPSDHVIIAADLHIPDTTH